MFRVEAFPFGFHVHCLCANVSLHASLTNVSMWSTAADVFHANPIACTSSSWGKKEKKQLHLLWYNWKT